MGAAIFNGVGLGTGASGTYNGVPSGVGTAGYGNGWFALAANTPIGAAGLVKTYPLVGGLRRCVLPFSST
jgi:hypothetical protein